MITDEQARKIANEWHGGRWSALYEFASTGVIIQEVIWEVEREIKDYPSSGYSNTKYKELAELSRYIYAKGLRDSVDGWPRLQNDSKDSTGCWNDSCILSSHIDWEPHVDPTGYSWYQSRNPDEDLTRRVEEFVEWVHSVDPNKATELSHILYKLAKMVAKDTMILAESKFK